MSHTASARLAPAAAAVLAALAAAPGLALPFVSDDWVHLWSADHGVFLANPFGFFRPLCALSYWLDWTVWGPTPAAFRATGILLAAAAAALVTIAARRFTGDGRLALGTGVAFALHPHHVGTVTWIAARSDLLAAVLVLATLIVYERWRTNAAANVPWAALLLYAVALQAKETAVMAPVALGAIALCRALGRAPDRAQGDGRSGGRGARSPGAEIVRGLAPLVALALVQFLVVRPLVFEGATLNHLKWLGAWRGSLLTYGATSIVPPPQEIFEMRPLAWSALALLVVAVLAAAAWRRHGGLPRLIWPAGAAFLALLGPSVIGFQIRYAYLPTAAALLALVALLRAAGPRVGGAVAALLLAGWSLSAVDCWRSEFAAGRASRALIDGLVRESRLASAAGAPTLVAAGIPHRVRGVPVTTDYDRVIPWLGGTQGLEVVTAGEFDFPAADADAVRAIVRRAGDRETGGRATRLDLSVPTGLWSRMARPLRANRVRPLDHPWGSMELRLADGRDGLIVTVRDDREARVVVWSGGELRALEALPRGQPQEGR